MAQCDYEQTFEKIRNLLQLYNMRIVSAEPLDEYGLLYRRLGAIDVPEENKKKNIVVNVHPCLLLTL